jgi:DNA-binding MarR family transcriptional regulator
VALQGTEPLLPEARGWAREQEEVTAKKVSVGALKLLRLLKEQADGSCSLEELAKDLRMSRAAASRALRELEYAGLVSLHVEEE